jgi:1-acyl-sn-glycerol-3-phosphate acyltransferase
MTGPHSTSLPASAPAHTGAWIRLLQLPLRTARVLWRFTGFCLLGAFSYLDYLWRVKRQESAVNYRLRAAWLGRWSGIFVRLLNIHVNCCGTPPSHGVIAANHLSYLDIVVLGSTQPMIFVSKSEVAGWPGIGALTRCAGTLFINRDKRIDVKDLTKDFGEVISQGQVLTLFPEGTSSDGSTVLVFHSSLFQAPAQSGWPVTAAWIGYTLSDGTAEDEVCYWRDMTFLPHFLNVLSKESIQATVAYGEPLEPGLNRKAMADILRKQVTSLAMSPPPPSPDFFSLGN